MVAALRQEQPTGAERIADGKGQRDFPDGAVELAGALVPGGQVGPPLRRYEAVRVAPGERAAGAGVERAQDLDRLQQGLAAAGRLERQPEESRQVGGDPTFVLRAAK